MDFANRGNRSAPQNSQPVNNQQPVAFESSKAPKMKNSSKFDLSKIGGLVLLGLVAILIAAVLVGLVFGKSTTARESDLINTSKYQAVFLDSVDGQVYCGNLEVYNEEVYRLTDIFYVRVEQALQPEGIDQTAQTNISLAKLGSELHGPEDAMFIQKSRVLYWENLTDEGQVATAITEFIANDRQTTDDTGAAQQTPVADPTATQPVGTEQVDDTPTETPVTP